jgi:uncharacterized protein YndB with AHSA1/START domain
MARSTFVYVTYIRTTPEKLWSALTDGEFMKQYWFGMHCESPWTAGSSWKLVSDGWPKVISNLKSLLETGSAVLQDPYRAESVHVGKA